MRLCIQYALTYPDRCESLTSELDLTKIMSLTFYKPNTAVFSPLDAAYRAVNRGGIIPCALNAANERAVELFIEGRISFREIIDVINEVTDNYNNINGTPSLEDITEADSGARRFTDRYFAK